MVCRVVVMLSVLLLAEILPSETRADPVSAPDEIFLQLGNLFPFGEIAFSTDDRWLFTISGETVIRKWDMTKGSLSDSLTGHRWKVSAIAVPVHGNVLFSGDDHEHIMVWDTNNDIPITDMDFSGPLINGIGKISISPAGDMFAFSAGKIVVADFATRKPILYLGDSSLFSRGLSFSPNGMNLISYGSNHSIDMWEIASGRHQLSFSGHTYFVSSAIFTNDGRKMISASMDGKIRIWDVEKGGTISILKEHIGPVNAIAVSPDGRTLISVGNDRTVKQWNLHDGVLINTIGEHQSRVLSVAISHSGKVVATGGEDAIIIWRTTDGAPLVKLSLFPEDQWASITPAGYFSGSANAGKFIKVRVGTRIENVDGYRKKFERPDLVSDALK